MNYNKSNLFNDLIIDLCPKHNKPIVKSLKNDLSESNDSCLDCMKRKEIPLNEFSEFLNNFEQHVEAYLKEFLVFNDGETSFLDIVNDLFNYRNESFNLLIKKDESLISKNNPPIINFKPFLYSTYLLNLATSQEVQNEIIKQAKQSKLSKQKEKYKKEILRDSAKLIFLLKDSEYLVENGLRKVSYVKLEDVFNDKDNGSFYHFLLENKLYFENNGEKCWYKHFDLPVMDKVYKIINYYGGHNSKDLKKGKIDYKKLPVWQEAVQTLKDDGIEPDVSCNISKDDLLLLDVALNWYPTISPTQFHAKQFDTTFIDDVDHITLINFYKLFSKFSKLYPYKKGVMQIPIIELKMHLMKEGKKNLFDILLSKMVIFYPVYMNSPSDAKLYLKTSKELYEKIADDYVIDKRHWTDRKIPLGFYYCDSNSGKATDYIILDFTIIPFYASVKLLYNREIANCISKKYGEFFEKQIAPFFIKRQGYDYISSETITKCIKKISNISYKEIEIDGVLVDRQEKNVYITEIKSITPKFSAIISKDSLCFMVAKILAEIYGEEIKDLNEIEIIVEKKPKGSSMSKRVQIIKENWTSLSLPIKEISVEEYSFKPLIITNVPVPINRRFIQKFDILILSLYDIMYELRESLKSVNLKK